MTINVNLENELRDAARIIRSGTVDVGWFKTPIAEWLEHSAGIDVLYYGHPAWAFAQQVIIAAKAIEEAQNGAL